MTQGAPTRSASLKRSYYLGRDLWAEGTVVVAKVVGGAPVAVAAEPEVAPAAEAPAAAEPEMAVAVEMVVAVEMAAAAEPEMAAAELEPGRVEEWVPEEKRRPAGRPVSRVAKRNGKTT